MKPIHHTSPQTELEAIEKQCAHVIEGHPSNAEKIVIVFGDKTGKTLSLLVADDISLLEKLPAGGNYFTGIN